MARKVKAEDTWASLVTSVRMPRSLHERLAQAGSEHGIGEEIRRRLEASFAEKSADDQVTSELLDGVAGVAKILERDAAGGWTADAWSFATFKAAIEALLDNHRPKDSATAKHKLFDVEKYDPATLGKSMAVTVFL